MVYKTACLSGLSGYYERSLDKQEHTQGAQLLNSSRPGSPSNSSVSVGSTSPLSDAHGDHGRSARILKPATAILDSGPPIQQRQQEAGYEKVNGPVHQCKNGADKQQKQIFGLVQERHSSETLPDDYEVRYCPDELGQEMGPNARVWRVYLDEAELNDRDMVEGWRDGVDVLLVFAGLFSAVVTTFVAQTSQKLDQDFSQISASLLTELIAIQRAVAVGAPIEGVPSAELNFSSPPRYTKADTWVNGLWFTSLALSLVTALSAVLIKQWIQHYISFVSGTPLERARIHQFRYLGLQQWGVRGIIGVLPVLVYAALFLFILGLVVFLQPLKVEIASVVGLIGGIAFVLYLATNGLPLFYPQCPYRTPLIEHINTILFYGSIACRRLLFVLIRRIIPRLLSHHWVSILHLPYPQQLLLQRWCQEMLETKPSTYECLTLRTSEFKAAELEQDKITHNIIVWLLTVSSNPSVRSIALQATSGLRVGYSRMAELFGEGSLVRNELVQELDRQRTIANEFGNEPATLVNSPLFYSAERIARAYMFIPESYWVPRPIWEPVDWREFDQASNNLGADSAFLQVLATYRGHSVHFHHYQDPLRPLSPLSDLVHTAKDKPVLWQAWSYGLRKGLSLHKTPISTLHNHFKQLFQAMLTFNTDSGDFGTLLPFLCQALPQNIVEECYGAGGPPMAWHVPPKALRTEQYELVIMLLRSVVVEWDHTHRYSAEMEDLIVGTCSPMVDSILYETPDGAMQQRLTAVLDKLIRHEGFIRGPWNRSTYEWLLFSYVRAYVQSPLPGPNAFSSSEWVHSMLKKAECTYGLLSVLFCSHSYWDIHLSLSVTASQAVRVLEGQAANDLMIKNIFDAFLDLSIVQDYLMDDVHPSYPSSWPPHIQPLVRWMLDYVIGHSGTVSHPSVEAFASHLVEQRSFLTFICSAFLIDTSRPVVCEILLSEEGYVLRRLAISHKGKAGALEVWRPLFSWVWDWSSWICDSEDHHRSWTRSEFEKYERMADLVDELADILKFNDPIPRVPRFEDSYITRFLKAKERPVNLARTAANASDLSKYQSPPKLSVFRKLIPWKPRVGPGIATTQGVDLESSPNL